MHHDKRRAGFLDHPLVVYRPPSSPNDSSASFFSIVQYSITSALVPWAATVVRQENDQIPKLPGQPGRHGGRRRGEVRALRSVLCHAVFPLNIRTQRLPSALPRTFVRRAKSGGSIASDRMPRPPIRDHGMSPWPEMGYISFVAASGLSPRSRPKRHSPPNLGITPPDSAHAGANCQSPRCGSRRFFVMESAVRRLRLMGEIDGLAW